MTENNNHPALQRLGSVEKIDEPIPTPASAEGSAPIDRSPSSLRTTPDVDQDNDIELVDRDLDPDHEEAAGNHAAGDAPSAPPPKKKGGRKPIYATSEERKQRNRQAQAAFRERRTEYIKQLEANIKRQDESISALQGTQRQALDECLMLRYKNSLLERILVEKGIDVQAELRAQCNSPIVGPVRSSTAPTAQPISRISGTGKFGRRPLSISAKPPDATLSSPIVGGAVLQPAPSPNLATVMQTRSPLSQPNSASHLPSPIAPLARSPNFIPQAGGSAGAGATISPALVPQPQPQQASTTPQMAPQSGPLRAQFSARNQQQWLAQNSMRSTPLAAATTPVQQATFAPNTMANASPVSVAGSAGGREPQQQAQAQGQPYFVPHFQNHYDQLDQEYDAQASMLEDDDDGTAAFTSAGFSAVGGSTNNAPMGQPPQRHPQQHRQQMNQAQMQRNQAQIQQQQNQHVSNAMEGIETSVAQTTAGLPGSTSATVGMVSSAQQQQVAGLPLGFDPFDPILDSDPFGLSASMTFPTPFNYETHR